jgi:hypothetical protein
MQWPDALGLGLFSASGTQLALAPGSAGHRGGADGRHHRGLRRRAARHRLQRDPKPPSTTTGPMRVCAFVGGWVLVAAQRLAWGEGAALLAAAGTATLLRLVALATGFRLPGWRAGG